MEALVCDLDGSARSFKIEFWGSEKQPEYQYVQWSCTKLQASFVCKQLGGTR